MRIPFFPRPNIFGEESEEEDKRQEKQFQFWGRYKDELNELEEIADWTHAKNKVQIVPKFNVIQVSEDDWEDTVNKAAGIPLSQVARDIQSSVKSTVKNISGVAVDQLVLEKNDDDELNNSMTSMINSSMILNTTRSNSTMISIDPCSKDQMNRFWEMIEYMMGINQLLLCLFVGLMLGWILARCRQKRQLRNIANQRNNRVDDQGDENPPPDTPDNARNADGPRSARSTRAGANVNNNVIPPRPSNPMVASALARRMVTSQRRRRSRHRSRFHRQLPESPRVGPQNLSSIPPRFQLPNLATVHRQLLRSTRTRIGPLEIGISQNSSTVPPSRFHLPRAPTGIVPIHGRQGFFSGRGSSNTAGILRNFRIPNGFPGFISPHPQRLRTPRALPL